MADIITDRQIAEIEAEEEKRRIHAAQGRIIALARIEALMEEVVIECEKVGQELADFGHDDDEILAAQTYEEKADDWRGWVAEWLEAETNSISRCDMPADIDRISVSIQTN